MYSVVDDGNADGDLLWSVSNDKGATLTAVELGKTPSGFAETKALDAGLAEENEELLIVVVLDSGGANEVETFRTTDSGAAFQYHGELVWGDDLQLC